MKYWLQSTLVFVCLTFVLAVSGFAQSSLPSCRAMNISDWSDCFGSAAYLNGDAYLGEFKDEKFHGRGVFASSNGSKIAGNYILGKRDGLGVVTFKSWHPSDIQHKFVGMYKDDQRNGQGVLYDISGNVIAAGTWSNDVLINRHAIDLNRFSFRLDPAATSTTTSTHLLGRPASQEMDTELTKLQDSDAQIAALQSSPQFHKRSIHALVIGNAAYPGSGRLDNPVNDANAISQKLRSMGFAVTTVTDANRQKLVQSMAQFRRTAAAADVSLLFYAGHGVQIFGTNYIRPTDVDQTDPAQATIQGVSLNSVVENFLPGKTKLVFLDACRDNPLQRTNDRSVSKGLAPISAAEGTLISYATKDGQTAADGAGAKNSPFTQALLEHISDPQDIAVVLRKVREKVMPSTGGKQQPWEYGSLTGGELILAKINGGR